MKTVLMATKRDGGEVMLAGPEVAYSEQMALRDKLHASGSGEYSSVTPCYLTPCKAEVHLKEPSEPITAETKSKKKSK